VPSPKVLMVIVGLYLAPFCYYSGFFFLRRNPLTAVPIGVVNVSTFCVFIVSLQLEDMHNCFCRMSCSSSVVASIWRSSGMGWQLDAKAEECDRLLFS
jgi:hypothetical protein